MADVTASTELLRDLQLGVSSETGRLKVVVLGIGSDPGDPRGTNAKSREAIRNGTFPTAPELEQEVDDFGKILECQGVKVLRPANLEALNQIFVRDLGFVVDDTLVIARMAKPIRQREIDGLSSIITTVGA